MVPFKITEVLRSACERPPACGNNVPDPFRPPSLRRAFQNIPSVRRVHAPNVDPFFEGFSRFHARRRMFAHLPFGSPTHEDGVDLIPGNRKPLLSILTHESEGPPLQLRNPKPEHL